MRRGWARMNCSGCGNGGPRQCRSFVAWIRACGRRGGKQEAKRGRSGARRAWNLMCGTLATTLPVTPRACRGNVLSSARPRRVETCAWSMTFLVSLVGQPVGQGYMRVQQNRLERTCSVFRRGCTRAGLGSRFGSRCTAEQCLNVQQTSLREPKAIGSKGRHH